MRNRFSTAAAVGLLLLGFGGSASADGTLIGKVAAVDAAAKTFTVQETGATESQSFGVDDDTKIREGRKEMDFSSLLPGRGVRVAYAEKDGAWIARRIDLSLPTGAAKP